MADNRGANDAPNQSDCGESYASYLNRAVSACEAGDLVLGMHLYLAAYEKAVVDPDIPDGMAIAGLREAWNLACQLKERSMAEYVFEKLEPFLTGDEIAACANMLQNLALDRLEEYGFSREELEDMAEMISQDFMGGEGSIVKVESITVPPLMAAGVIVGGESDDEDAGESTEDIADEISEDEPAPEAEAPAPVLDEGAPEDRFEPTTAAKKRGRPEQTGVMTAPPDFNPYDEFNTSSVGTSFHAATNDGSGAYVFTRDADRAKKLGAASSQGDASGKTSGKQADDATAQPSAQPAEAQPSAPQAAESSATLAPAQVRAQMQAQAKARGGKDDLPSMPNVAQGPYAFNYRQLVGYDGATALMRDYGIGLQRDGDFKNFVSMMNARHGIESMPALDTLLFRAPVIEDATRFVDATIGEIGLPVLRMSMEEGFQGAPMLCVTTFGDSRPRMNHANNRFAGPGILVIDDLDMWTMPQAPENVEGIAGFVMANISRGAREAINLIRSAVEDPDVYVLATATTQGEPEAFFYDVLEPITIVDIGLPTEHERDAIWASIMNEHPSMSALDRDMLVRLSDGLPRYDLYMTARAAVEEAYKAGLVQRMFLPVTMQNILDKLAACQPLDSDEYRAIEDEIVRQFRDGFDELEHLMDETAE